ncbi:unnamed protein product, partial [Meganyctiphanes norvegica]
MAGMTRFEGGFPGMLLGSLALLLLLATCIQDASAKSYGIINKERRASVEEDARQAEIKQNYKMLLHKMNVLKRSLKSAVTSRSTSHDSQKIYDESVSVEDQVKKIIFSIPRTF